MKQPPFVAKRKKTKPAHTDVTIWLHNDIIPHSAKPDQSTDLAPKLARNVNLTDTPTALNFASTSAGQRPGPVKHRNFTALLSALYPGYQVLAIRAATSWAAKLGARALPTSHSFAPIPTMHPMLPCTTPERGLRTRLGRDHPSDSDLLAYWGMKDRSAGETCT